MHNDKQYMSYECSSSDYNQAESWCSEIIASGHEMIFSLQSFHDEIAKASKRFGLSFEVSQKMCTYIIIGRLITIVGGHLVISYPLSCVCCWCTIT